MNEFVTLENVGRSVSQPLCGNAMLATTNENSGRRSHKLSSIFTVHRKLSSELTVGNSCGVTFETVMAAERHSQQSES